MNVNTSVSGGNRIGQRLSELRREIERRNSVYVGLPKGTGSYEDGTPIAVIGAVHEFGSADGHIPERSFLRVPIRANSKEFAQIFKELMPQVMGGQITMFQMLEQVGAKAAATSQEAISDGIAPSNAQSTIDRKGSSTPLVDSGSLRQNITYIIEGDENA